jgi:hypothetical protein
MADIFISYAHKDQAFVRRMVSTLEAEGFSVWWDHTIPPGQSWDSFIARGIKEAKAAIVVWSQNSVDSEWVKEEAQLARGSGKYLPVTIDGGEPPMGFTRIQAASLSDWSGDVRHPQWQMLLREARNLVGAAEANPSPTQPRAPAYHPPQTRPPPRKSGVAIVLVGAGIAAAAAPFLYFAQQRSFDSARQADAAPASAIAPDTAADAPTSSTVGAAPAPSTAAVQTNPTQQAEIQQLRRERDAALAQRTTTAAAPASAQDIVGTWAYTWRMADGNSATNTKRFFADGRMDSAGSGEGDGRWTLSGSRVSWHSGDGYTAEGTIANGQVTGIWRSRHTDGTFTMTRL